MPAIRKPRLDSGSDELHVWLRKLTILPSSGTPRDDLGEGLRSVPFKRRWIVSYEVETQRVRVLRIIAGERDLGPGDFATM